MALLELIVSNTCDVANILYSKGFQQRVWLEADISQPQYVLVTEATEDGDSNEIRNYNKVLKKYKLRILMPEFFMDGLHLLTLHDSVSIILPDGRNEKIYNVELNGQPAWDEHGCLAATDVFFYTETFNFSKNSCCELINSECLEERYTAVDFITVDDAEYTDPKGSGVNVGDTYLIGFGGTETAFGVYQWNGTTWVQLTHENGDIVLNSDSGLFWYATGNNSFLTEVPRLDTATRTVDEVFIKGKAIPGMFIRVYWKTFGMADFDTFSISANAFITGYTFDVTGNCPTTVKVQMYTHNCDYGTTEQKIILCPA